MATGMLSSCKGAEIDGVALLSAIADSAQAAVPALRLPEDRVGGEVEVYVDLSLTMRPFLQGAQPALTPYYGLLEQLNDDLGGDVEFYGFGVVPGAAAQTVDRLGGVSRALRVASYDRLNNDYAGLFETFIPDVGYVEYRAPTRIVITDGVESDAEGGRRYGSVVAAVDRWVRAGGAFAVLVFRSGYQGMYYAESAACAGAKFAWSCNDRPVVAFVFADGEGRIAQVRAALAGGGRRPDYALVVGGASEYDLQPVAEVEVEGRSRPDRLLRDMTTVFVDDTRPFSVARVSQQAIDAAGFFPLTVVAQTPEGPAWERLDPAARARFLGSLRPEVHAWAIESAGRRADGRDSLVLHAVEVVEKPGAAEVVVDSSGGVRVTVPVFRPEPPSGLRRTRRFAWLVTLTPYETAPLLIPDALSTTADCSNDQCSRVLNLSPMLGAILRDDYVPGRAFFVTDWPE